MWLRTTSFLLLGYLSFSRAFAYLGVPTWKLFVGEVVMAFLCVSGPRLEGTRWPWFCLKLPALKPILTWYVLFLGYGVVEVLHGIWAGNPALVALRDLAFQYYPLYFCLGLWAGAMRPEFLPKLLYYFAWFNGIYGLLFIVFLSRVSWFVPGVGEDVVAVPIFGQPIYSFVALLGLLVYQKNLKRIWYLLLLNGFVMLGMQIRTEWLAFAVGVIVWLGITRQGKRLLQAGAVLASFFILLYVTDFTIPSPQGRAEADFSARQVVDRGLAVFRADVTDVNTAVGVGNVDSQEATFVFRTVWWLAIWDSAHADITTALFGHGYGFPLGDLVPYLEGEFIRTPHNEFFYALGYTGWIGVVLFFAVQLEILRLLWRAMRITGEPFGVIYWVAMTVLGMFFPLGETPYGAVPFYLVIGWIASRVSFERAAVSGSVDVSSLHDRSS